MTHIGFDTDTRRGVFLCDSGKTGQTYYHIDSIRNSPELLEDVRCPICRQRWKHNEAQWLSASRLDSIIIEEISMEINSAVLEVYEKTEQAVLVSRYSNTFGIEHNHQRSVMFLRNNKKAVLQICEDLAIEEEDNSSK